MYKTAEKKFEDLNFTDSFMFAKVMRNENICKSFLESLFQIKIKKIKYLEDEKTIDITKYSKGIRLDVYVEDNNNTIFNIEMQIDSHHNIVKRSRYYQDLIDLNTLEKGARYDTLKESYIIFICLFDPFHCGQFIYTFENTCREVDGLTLGDGTTKIFINPKGPVGNISSELRNLFAYIIGHSPEGKLANDINSIVANAKYNLSWRSEYMSLSLLIQEEIEEARKEAKEEAMQEARKIAKKEAMQEARKEAMQEARKEAMRETRKSIDKSIKIIKAYNRGLSMERISAELNYPLKEVSEIITMYEA